MSMNSPYCSTVQASGSLWCEKLVISCSARNLATSVSPESTVMLLAPTVARWSLRYFATRGSISDAVGLVGIVTAGSVSVGSVTFVSSVLGGVVGSVCDGFVSAGLVSVGFCSVSFGTVSAGLLSDSGFSVVCGLVSAGFVSVCSVTDSDGSWVLVVSAGFVSSAVLFFFSSVCSVSVSDSAVPVVSVDGTYLGAITRDRLVDALSELCNAEAAGSVIVLEMMPQDYSLTDIARLVEANNAHVLNLLSHQDKDTGRLLITLKIDLEDASPVIRSFERFNYTVLYHFMEKGMVDDMLRQRMNELLHYMNM